MRGLQIPASEATNRLGELIIGGSLTSFEIIGTAREAGERT
jgi:hypothetical protein